MPTFEAKLSPSEDCTSSPPPPSPSSPSPTHQPIYHHRCNIIKTSGSSSSNALLRTLASTHCYYFYYYRRIFVQPFYYSTSALPTATLFSYPKTAPDFAQSRNLSLGRFRFFSPSLFFCWLVEDRSAFLHIFVVQQAPPDQSTFSLYRNFDDSQFELKKRKLYFFTFALTLNLCSLLVQKKYAFNSSSSLKEI